MAKGRKAIPSKIVNLRGGTKHTHKKPRDQEPQPPESMPDIPDHLEGSAKGVEAVRGHPAIGRINDRA